MKQQNHQMEVTEPNPFRGRNMTCIIPRDFGNDTAFAIILIQFLCERPVHIVSVDAGTEEADNTIEKWRASAHEDKYIGCIEIDLNRGKYRRPRKTDSYELHTSLFKNPDTLYSVSGRIFRDYEEYFDFDLHCDRSDFYDVFISPLDDGVTDMWKDPIHVLPLIQNLTTLIDEYLEDILNWGKYTYGSLAVLHREKMFFGHDTRNIDTDTGPDKETMEILSAGHVQTNKYLHKELWLIIPDNFDADVSLSIILLSWLARRPVRVVLFPHGYDVVSEAFSRSVTSISGNNAVVVSIGFENSKEFRRNGSTSISGRLFQKYWKFLFENDQRAASFYESFCVRPCSFADEKPLPRLKDFLEDFFDRMNRNSLVADAAWKISRDWDNVREIVLGPIDAIRSV